VISKAERSSLPRFPSSRLPLRARAIGPARRLEQQITTSARVLRLVTPLHINCRQCVYLHGVCLSLRIVGVG
jgi:hypothetical protein